MKYSEGRRGWCSKSTLKPARELRPRRNAWKRTRWCVRVHSVARRKRQFFVCKDVVTEDVVTVASHGGASRGGTPAITLECHVTVLVAE